jgi:N-methylhydantoinase B
MFLRQSRVPANVQMDLRSAVSANRVASGRIAALVDRYGADAVKSVMNRVLDAGERTVAERLAKIPDGRWSHRIYAEAAHTGDAGLYTYQITVRKQDEQLYVDNAGTDPQTGSINVTYAGFSGAFLAALTASLTADLAGAYGGVYRRVHFEPVPGTLSCADFPRRSARPASTRWRRSSACPGRSSRRCWRAPSRRWPSSRSVPRTRCSTASSAAGRTRPASRSSRPTPTT